MNERLFFSSFYYLKDFSFLGGTLHTQIHKTLPNKTR
jgi:hypothetical protein